MHERIPSEYDCPPASGREQPPWLRCAQASPPQQETQQCRAARAMDMIES
jgi:hypothetical protein